MKKLITVIASLILSTNVLADDNTSGPYMGVGGTYGVVDVEDVDLNMWGTNVFAGYRINPYVAAELSVSHSTLDDSDEGVHFSGDLKQIDLSIRPIYPISPNLDIFGSIGYSYGTSSVRGASGEGVGYSSEGSIPDGWTTENVFWFDTTESASAWPVMIGMDYKFDKAFIRASIGTVAEDFGDLVTVGISLGIAL